MTALQQRIGARLRKAREPTGLSQEQAGVKLGSTRGTVALYESGKRKAPAVVLHAMARLYGVSADYLLCLTDDPAPHQRPSSLAAQVDTAVDDVVEPRPSRPKRPRADGRTPS